MGSAEGAARDQENPDVLRRGEALAGRRSDVGQREPGEAEPYGEEGRRGGVTRGKRGMHPGERGTARGEEERARDQ